MIKNSSNKKLKQIKLN